MPGSGTQPIRSKLGPTNPKRSPRSNQCWRRRSSVIPSNVLRKFRSQVLCHQSQRKKFRKPAQFFVRLCWHSRTRRASCSRAVVSSEDADVHASHLSTSGIKIDPRNRVHLTIQRRDRRRHPLFESQDCDNSGVGFPMLLLTEQAAKVCLHTRPSGRDPQWWIQMGRLPPPIKPNRSSQQGQLTWYGLVSGTPVVRLHGNPTTYPPTDATVRRDRPAYLDVVAPGANESASPAPRQ